MVRRRLASLLGRAHVLYRAVRDERTPRRAKVVALVALAWVFVPLDFDFVPLLGWVDDALVIWLGSQAVGRLTPPALMAEFEAESPRPIRRFVLGALAVELVFAVAIVVLIWWLLFAG